MRERERERERERRRNIPVSPTTTPSIAIRDRDLGSSSLAYIRDLAIDASRDRAVNRDLDPMRSRKGEIAINGAIL